MATIKQEEIEEGWDAFMRNFENGPDIQIIGENITFDDAELSLITGQETALAVDPSRYQDTSEPDDVKMCLESADQILDPAEGFPNIDLSQQTNETLGNSLYSADQAGLPHHTSEVAAEDEPYCSDQVDFAHESCDVPVGYIPDTGEAFGTQTEGDSNKGLGAKLDAIKAM